MPGVRRKPRWKSAAGRAALPARWSFSRRSAPAPQATRQPVVDQMAGSALALDHLGLENLHPLAGDLAPGAGPGRQGPDPAVELHRRLPPIEPLLLAGELGGIGGALGRLRNRREAPGRQTFQRLDDQLGPEGARRSCRLAAGLPWADLDGSAQQDRAGIQPLVHLHDGDAALPVAGEDGALDRGRPAPARQQRGMDIEAAEPRALQDRAAAAAGHRRRPRRHRGRGRRIACCASAVFRLTGVRTGRPWDSASCCTGEGRGCWPRPAGRGGWL